jgi:putative NADH-flavin reductase
MAETIALFGGTGRTGRHVVAYALEKGYKIQMLARSPNKVEIKHENLTVIEGDLLNEEALKKVVKDATYVISCVGGPASAKTYPEDMMINFITLLVPIMEAEASIKVFLYQAGGFSPVPGKPLTFMTSLMRRVIVPMIGIGPMLRDNDQVITYLAENKKHFEFIVTRPAMLEEKDNDLVVVADHNKMNMSTITYKALAIFTVDALKDSSLYGTYPYAATAKK